MSIAALPGTWLLLLKIPFEFPAFFDLQLKKLKQPFSQESNNKLGKWDNDD